MKTVSLNKGSRGNSRTADPGTDFAEAARAARAAIQKDPESPENYTILAGALRLLAQSQREQHPHDADHLLHLACAAAWEAKLKSGPGLTSGRTKQELKSLIAWLRIRNHVTPEAAEGLMDQIHSEYLGRALDESDTSPVSDSPVSDSSPDSGD